MAISFVSFALTASRLSCVVSLIVLAGCGRSPVDAMLERDCSDGNSCYKQAQGLVRRNYQERSAKEKSAKERSAERAARAVVLFQKGCDLGAGRSCAVLGDWLMDGGLAPPDWPRAVRLYETGCALKDVVACDRLSHLYRDGRGVPKDSVRQAKYRQLACGLAETMTRETFCSDNL